MPPKEVHKNLVKKPAVGSAMYDLQSKASPVK